METKKIIEPQKLYEAYGSAKNWLRDSGKPMEKNLSDTPLLCQAAWKAVADTATLNYQSKLTGVLNKGGGNLKHDIINLEPEQSVIPAEECNICHGSGEFFTHSEDCTNDLCALNCDEYSGVLIILVLGR